MKKRGFTLVELSIVLVIIGLLIGGILVGQSLIESAKINSEVRRLTQYSIAINLFQDRFKQAPGDSMYFSNPGNNDGDNQDSIGICPSVAFERESAWSHLSQSNMLNETYESQDPSSSCPGWSGSFVGAAPTHTIKANGSTSIISLLYYRENFVVRAGSLNPFTDGSYKYAFLTNYDAEILWGLENKLDDGLASITTGSIESYTSEGFICDYSGVQQEISIQGEGSDYCEVLIYFNHSL